jgi:hypothetical protein
VAAGIVLLMISFFKQTLVYRKPGEERGDRNA